MNRFIVVLLGWSIHSTCAAAANVDHYRRVSIRLTDDRGERPPRYQSAQVFFEELVFFVAPVGELNFARANYVVLQDRRRRVLDTGLSAVEVDTIEAHEVAQAARRAEALRNAAYANVPIEDPREPRFPGDGHVLRVRRRTEESFVQIAVALLDGVQDVRPNDFPVWVHLIHDESPKDAPPRAVARRYALGVAHVEPLRTNEAALVSQLVELSGDGCDGRLRN